MAESALPGRAEAEGPRGEGLAPLPAVGSAGSQERAEEAKPGRGCLSRAAAPWGGVMRSHLRPGSAAARFPACPAGEALRGQRGAVPPRKVRWHHPPWSRAVQAGTRGLPGWSPAPAPTLEAAG